MKILCDGCSVENVVIGQAGQALVQINIDPDKLKLRSPYGNSTSGRRLAWLGHKPSKLAITGSNPVDRTTTLQLREQACLMITIWKTGKNHSLHEKSAENSNFLRLRLIIININMLKCSAENFSHFEVRSRCHENGYNKSIPMSGYGKKQIACKHRGRPKA